jgi:hypothetical protein
MFATMNAESQCLNSLTNQLYPCGSPIYILFWFPFIFVGQKMVLELFVLVILEQFEKSYIQENNPLGLFHELKGDFI